MPFVEETLNINSVQSVTDLTEAGLAQAGDGFANENSKILGGDTFELKDIGNLLASGAGNPTDLRELDARISISSDGEDVTLTVDGRSYDLNALASLGTYSQDDFLETAYLTRVYVPNDFVEYFQFEATETEYSIDEVNETEVFTPIYETSGLYTIGYLADPAFVTAVTGEASFVGEMSVLLALGAERVGYATGDVSLLVNFDDDTIAGNANLSSDFKPGFNTPIDLEAASFSLGLETGSIVDGAFTGNLVLTDTITVDIPRTGGSSDFSDLTGEYDGAFYGPVLDSVGGQIAGSASAIDGEEDLNIVGAFIGSR